MNQLLLTEDGSHSLYSERFAQAYHSTSGAVQESRRVFIELGLESIQKDEIHILEVGFGTGLNTLMTVLAAKNKTIHYTTIEAYPLVKEEVMLLNHGKIFGEEALFSDIHSAPWDTPVSLREGFILHKKKRLFEEAFSQETTLFDLIYYDAFAPKKQPELWTPEVFLEVAKLLQKGGILVTYSVKGSVKRALKAAGFRIEKHPGTGRKWEVLRAVYEG